MTFQELMARAGAERSSGWGETGALLSGQASKEKFNIEHILNLITGAGQEAETKDISRKRRKSGWRLGGAILGGLGGLLLGGPGGALKGKQWGTAIGAGLGSLGGSQLAKATEPGGWALKGVGGIPSLLSSGMFFQTGREKGDIRKADISRSIEEANKSYEQAVYVDALRDALSGYSLASLKPGDWFDQGLEGKVLPDSPISSGYDWNV